MRRAGILLLVAGLLVSPLLAPSSPGQQILPPPPQDWAEDFADDRFLDPTFGAGGRVVTQLRTRGVSAMSLQKDGRIVVASAELSLLFRLLPTGAFDPSFGGGGTTGVKLHPPSGQPNIPGGLFPPVGVVAGSTGPVDTPDAQALAVQEDGKILVAGSVVRHENANLLGGERNFYLARYLPSGVLDPAFADGGIATTHVRKYDVAFDVDIQAGGKIILAGASRQASNSDARFVVLRYEADGRPDSSFGTDGVLEGPPGMAYSGLIQPDGKIIVGGGAGHPDSLNRPRADFTLARFNADGSSDTSFGDSGVVRTDFDGRYDQAFDLALQPGPGGLKIIAGGCSNTNTTRCYAFHNRIAASGGDSGAPSFLHSARVALARYSLEDGALDPTFGSGGKVAVTTGGSSSIAIQNDRKIVASLNFNPVWNQYGRSDFQVVRYEPDGQIDAAFGTGGTLTTKFAPYYFRETGPQVDEQDNNFTQAVAVQPDGKILAAGHTGRDFNGDIVLARYLNTASPTDADLAVSISDAPDPAARGDMLHYRMEVDNLAMGPAFGVTLTQTIPPGVNVFSAKSSQGPCSISTANITCSLGSMLGGARAEITVDGTVTSEGPRLTSTASVTTSSNDPNAANNTASAETAVGRPAGQWTLAGSMTHARTGHSATQLRNGKILAAGGVSNGPVLGSAELYDPVSDTWSPTSPLTTPRAGHTATILPSGKVVVAGGSTPTQQAIASVEVYDPTTGAWTQGVPMLKPRYGHTATLLDSGKILIAGGRGTPNSLAEAELYSPGVLSADPNAPGLTRTGATEPVGSLSHGRSFFTATLLPGGKVLAVGGYRGPRYEIDDPSDPGDEGGPYAKTEIYNPATGRWDDTEDNAVGRWMHTATLLDDGRVLVAGGNVTTGGAIPTSSSEIFSPADGKWIPAGALGTARLQQGAILLPGGKVLVAGGRGREPAGQAIRTAELFDPSTGGWSATDIMHFARYDHPLLNIVGAPVQCGQRCGKVLAAGGTGERTTPAGGEPQATAEYYSPPQPQSEGEPPPGPGDDPVVKQPIEDEGVNQSGSSRQDQLASPLPAPPAPPSASPAVLGSVSASPLSVTNPEPGPLGATTLMQGGAAAAGTGLLSRQPGFGGQPGIPEVEVNQEPRPAQRWAMVMLAPVTLGIWFSVAIAAIFGCIVVAARALAAAAVPRSTPAWAMGITRPLIGPRRMVP